jgi:hypothetical protein
MRSNNYIMYKVKIAKISFSYQDLLQPHDFYIISLKSNN